MAEPTYIYQTNQYNIPSKTQITYEWQQRYGKKTPMWQKSLRVDFKCKMPNVGSPSSKLFC